MKLYTYSDARQRFASVLETASKEGKVLIRKRDGTLFAVTPEPDTKSPFEVQGVATDLTTSELVDLIREERGKSRTKA